MDYLAGQGVRVALQGHQPIMAGIQAVYATLKALKEGTPPAELDGLPSGELMKQVMRGAEVQGWTREFLGGE